MYNLDRNDRALALAYDRCEYVTKLFSKTFYMGTSLMRPDARKHVSATNVHTCIHTYIYSFVWQYKYITV